MAPNIGDAKMPMNLPTPDEELQAKIEAAIQPILDSSVTPIIGSVNGQFFQWGTGTYFSVGDHYFVVTADHVPRKARSKKISLYIPSCEPDQRTPRILPLTGLMVSGVGKHLDVAIAELSAEVVRELHCRRFLRLHDVSFKDVKDIDAWYYIAGHPQSLCRVGDSGNVITIEGIGYLTCQYKNAAQNLENYDPDVHLLLDYALSDTCDVAGDQIEPTDQLGGISGSSIWEVYRPGQDLQSWSPNSIKVVGVQTAVYCRPSCYRDGILVRATAWGAVAKLLWLKFEELRPSLRLWMPEEWTAQYQMLQGE